MLALDIHQQNIQVFLDHAAEYHAERVAEIGANALPELIRAAIERAVGYGLTDTADICRFLDLVVTFGLDWTQGERVWMHERMTDASKGDPARRLERLRREILYRLEDGAL